ncbi:MAG: hemerythrin family protein [SAR324 cluster bacterium]|uniref:Hemerythrin family protein n=1 Tax=SAR324 cluster bacterium TaxID=2024889 RepID=A0A7X9FPK0_9DELT|nr:hemerythrin family protein [SAR324 cluster bacterium]
MTNNIKKLLLLLNQLADKIYENKSQAELLELFQSFIKFYREHAACEEKLLAGNNYIGLEKQRNDHVKIIKELENCYERSRKGDFISIKLITKFRDEVLSHILGPDKAYGEFLPGQGVR